MSLAPTIETRKVTIELPEPVYRLLAQIADATQLSLETLAAQSVSGNLPPSVETAPSSLRDELLAMQALPPDELLQIANLRVDAEDEAKHLSLLEKNSDGGLNKEESEELSALRLAADELMVRKAYAWALLRWRGYRVPPLDDLPLKRAMPVVPENIRRQVFAEAHYRCEYCQTSHRLLGMPPTLDHILPIALGGSDTRENLAAACYRCNEYKGAKTHALDPLSGDLVPLFNPRTQVWSEHFTWANGGTHIVGLTAWGRATVVALRLNNEYVVEARALWIAREWHPPSD
jgi:hypothetical protein